MTDKRVDVRMVENEADMKAFLCFPWTCYRDNPYWVPPLFSTHKENFDRQKNVELHHITIDYFVAWRDSAPIGTIAAFVNHAHNEFHRENIGFFGNFEVLEDRAAAHALLEAAETWCREHKVAAIRGPATFSTNSEFGLLVEGFDSPPMIFTTYAQPYYRDFIESAGYSKEMDMFAFHVDVESYRGDQPDNILVRLTRVMDRLRQRRNFVVRNVNLRDLDNEVARIKKIYNSAWEKNWGFVPLCDAEFDKFAQNLKSIIDPDVSFFVEVDGEPVAFSVPLPDINQPLRLAHPRPDEPEILALLRLMWHWKVRRRLTRVRLFALGVLEGYRGTGVDALLYLETIKAGLRKGYIDAEMSWILENNDMMMRSAQTLGAKVYKTYRAYEKPL